MLFYPELLAHAPPLIVDSEGNCMQGDEGCLSGPNSFLINFNVKVNLTLATRIWTMGHTSTLQINIKN